MQALERMGLYKLGFIKCIANPNSGQFHIAKTKLRCWARFNLHGLLGNMCGLMAKSSCFWKSYQPYFLLAYPGSDFLTPI